MFFNQKIIGTFSSCICACVTPAPSGWYVGHLRVLKYIVSSCQWKLLFFIFLLVRCVMVVDGRFVADGCLFFSFFFSLSSRESACLFFSFCFSISIPIIFYHLFFFHKPFRKVFNVFDLVLKLQSIIYYFFLIRSLFFWFWFFFYVALLLKFCWFQFHTLIKIYVVLFFKIYSSFFWFPFSLVKVFFSFRFNSPI